MPPQCTLIFTKTFSGKSGLMSRSHAWIIHVSSTIRYAQFILPMQRATFLLPIAKVVAKTAPSDVNPDENEVEKAMQRSRGGSLIQSKPGGSRFVYGWDLWRHTWRPYVSVAPDATHKERLRALEGRHISSKRVEDEGVAGRTGGK